MTHVIRPFAVEIVSLRLHNFYHFRLKRNYLLGHILPYFSQNLKLCIHITMHVLRH